MAVMIAHRDELLTVPVWVTDLASFRRWSHMDEFLEEGKILYFDGNILVDQSMESLLHTLIKTAIATSIQHWATRHTPGIVCIDSMRMMNEQADLSSEPDVIFISNDSLESGLVQIENGDASLEIEGSPDLIVEIISPSSNMKDSNILRRKYWQAGVKEYWLADSRKAPSLSILHRNSKQFIQPKEDVRGWHTSHVLQAKCKLNTEPGPAGTTRVTLEIKPSPQ